MRVGLRARILAPAAVLALAVGGVFALLLVTIGNLRGAGDLARHSEQVIATANRAERLVFELQSAQRGFIITSEQQYLDSWQTARRELPGALDTLARLVADNPAQEARATALRRDALSYVDNFAIHVVTTARIDRKAAVAMVATGEGSRRVAEIATEVDAVVSADAALAQQRRSRATSASHLAIALGAGGLAGSTLLIILFSGIVTRKLVVPLRRVSTAAGRLAAGDYSARAPDGVAEIGELARAFNGMADAVTESRDELERFFTLSLDLLVIAGMDGRFRRVNPAWESVLGYTPDELVSRPFLDFVHPDDRAATLAEVDRQAGGDEVVSFENRYRARDGSYRWLLWSSVPYPERDLLYAVARDITDRKQSEEEIRHLNAELEHQAVELEHQNAELESQTVLLEENQAQLAAANDELQAQQAELERAVADLAEEKERIESLYRFGARLAAEIDAEPLARTILEQIADIAHAEVGALYVRDPEHGDAHALAASRGLEPAALAAAIRPGEGLAGRALAERRTLRDEHGASGLTLPGLAGAAAAASELHVPLVHAGSAVGVLTLGRVGERPYSAEELDAVEHLADPAAVALAHALALRAAGRLASINAAVLDATGDAISMLDGHGLQVLANEAMRNLSTNVLGVSPGNPVDSAALFAPRTTDPARFLAAVEARTADPEAELRDEFTLVDPPLTFERFTAPVRGEDGAIVGRIVVLRDVTAQREAERFKDELMATVSHELRTPLTGILGFAELLVSRDLDAGTRRHHLQTIHEEATRLTALLNDFLDVERFDSGQLVIARETFSVGDLLEQQVALFAGQSAAHPLDLELSEGRLDARGDANQTARAVANLLSNAIKYSPGGGTVTIAASNDATSIRVAVTDRGLGIPADQQHRVFDRFFRVDSTDTREIGGTGLGLALVKEIVEAQGGRIGFESVHGVGSTFWFELPAA